MARMIAALAAMCMMAAAWGRCEAQTVYTGQPWQSIAAENTFSSPVSVHGNFNVSFTGTWSATVYVQRSFDNGVTWQDVGSYTENAELTGFEPESGVRYRFGVKAGGYSSGTVVGRISQ
jgi:hypothetical protein